MEVDVPSDVFLSFGTAAPEQCRTQAEALTAACTRLATLDQSVSAGAHPTRVSGTTSYAA
ncbi:hypothetical protein ACFPJ1_10155 [Kribbella qitaiheensis]|uniref:hypothetical protein n=1 Tax=Kribbella qitaiheensis TaxID=1544730 RepID=UPI00361BA196